MNTLPLALEVTPEQVSSIQILKGKQLHLTLDGISSIGSILSIYGELISKFLEDNMAININIELKTIQLVFSDVVTVVIISIQDVYVK